MLNREVVENLEQLARAATQGEWVLATSCSWRRILTADGNPVIVPITQRSDDHPDLSAGQDHVNAELACAAVNALPELLRVYRAWLDAPYGLSEHIVDGLVYVRGDAITAAIHNGGDDEYVSVRLVRDGDSGEGES